MTPDMNIKKILLIEIKSFIETRYYPPYYQGPYIDRVLVITSLKMLITETYTTGNAPM